VENSPQSPNLVEGRELYAPQAVALDNSVSPPILYVSDYVNNRVLAWKNAATFTTGQKADLAIGQPDLDTTFPQGPSAVAQNSSTYTTGLTRPSGLAVDGNGNLYVVDAGNNRVLRYPKPFAQTGQFPEPDLWIGQATVGGYGANYPGGTSTPTAQGLLLSNGSTVLTSSLAFDSSGNLWVLDTGNARVIRFNASSLSSGGGSLTADMESASQASPATRRRWPTLPPASWC
jgi:sugar lactone lactonase YvrE